MFLMMFPINAVDEQKPLACVSRKAKSMEEDSF